MPFGIPEEDFHGGFGLPDSNEWDAYSFKTSNRPVDTEVIGSELVGYCPQCGHYVTECACNYCPHCGIRLNWD